MTYGVAFGCPHSRSVLVSFSVNSSSAASGQCSSQSPISAWDAVIVEAPSALIEPWGRPIHHVLRSHSVGSRWTWASSAERLRTVMRMTMSSGLRLAYSTSMST